MCVKRTDVLCTFQRIRLRINNTIEPSNPLLVNFPRSRYSVRGCRVLIFFEPLPYNFTRSFITRDRSLTLLTAATAFFGTQHRPESTVRNFGDFFRCPGTYGATFVNHWKMLSTFRCVRLLCERIPRSSTTLYNLIMYLAYTEARP